MRRLLSPLVLVAFSPVVAADPPKPIRQAEWVGVPVLSPDGKFLVMLGHVPNVLLSQSSAAHVLNVGTGEKLVTLQGHDLAPNEKGSRWLRDASFSPDGKTLATAGTDGAVIVWDWKAGKELRRLKGHASAVVRVVFSPTGKHLASAASDGVVKVWNVEDGKCVATLAVAKVPIEVLTFSPDGKLLASAYDDRRVRIWNWGEDTHVTSEHTRSTVPGMAFSPDGKLLACGLSTEAVVLESATGRQVRVIRHPQVGRIPLVGFLDKGRLLVLGTISNLYYHDLEQDGKLVAEKSIYIPKVDTGTMAVSADFKLLAVLVANREAHFIPIPQTPPPK